ncbi:MAG: FHA domain-containing protein [Steroidobacteraceae bacterium]
MNASTNSFTSTAADAEITAELPALDIAAYEARHGHDPLSSTDTWSSPTLNTAILPQLNPLAPETAPEPTATATQSASLAAKLEVELKSLASNLTELETRLAAKGERLTMIEAELAEAHLAGKAAALRAATLAEELAVGHAALAAGAAQIEALEASVREREESAAKALERESELRHSLAKREADFDDRAAVDAARTATLVAGHDVALKASWQQIAQLQIQNAAHLETLQSLEGRRGIFDSMLRGLDLQIGSRDQEQARLAEDLARNTTHGLNLTLELEGRAQRVTQLEAEVATLNARLGMRADEAGAIARTNDELNKTVQALQQEGAVRAARIAELEAQGTAAIEVHAQALRAAAAAHTELKDSNSALAAQKATLDAELAALREQTAGHVAAVKQLSDEHAERVAQLQSREAEVIALAAQVATQAQTLQVETERNRVNEERIAIHESDLRVSEEAINRLESEVRSRNMRVEELTRINSQMQADIADARRWLDERDSLMQRLETEAAHSSALVDNIQRSIRSLSPGSSGTHEAIRENGARLLVRSKDGHEVVHVLGRKTTIGRTPDNDLQIDATFISRHHAVLLINGQQTIIEDLNSTNGVHVNGHRISREALNDGDLVMVGKARFRFVIRPAVARNNTES